MVVLGTCITGIGNGLCPVCEGAVILRLTSGMEMNPILHRYANQARPTRGMYKKETNVAQIQPCWIPKV